MFTYDAVIDAVQTGKKTWVNSFVTNESAKDAMIKFIDVQSDYTKKVAKASNDVMATMANETIKAAQEAVKFDYVKFNENVMKAYSKFGEKIAK